MAIGNGHTPANQRELVFLDLETSSLDPDRGCILDLAAVRLTADLSRQTHVVHRKCRLDRPEHATKEALEVCGYNAHEWRDAVPARVAIIELASIMDPDVVLVGHNVGFDWAFACANYLREELVVPSMRYTVDTIGIAWPLAMRGYIDKLGLEAICSRYGISNHGQHRAMADVQRTVLVYCALLGLKKPDFLIGGT